MHENIVMFLISNIKVQLYSEDDSVSELFKFIREKCPQQLRSLQIHINYGELNVIYDNNIGTNVNSSFWHQKLP